MKKVIFSAVACMALIGSAFAANGEKAIQPKLLKIIEDDCIWHVTVRDSKGNLVADKWHSGSESSEDCIGLAKEQVKSYQEKYPDMIVKYIIGGSN